MGLEALLVTMESRAADTPVTPRYQQGVTAKASPIKACTPVTPVTPKKDHVDPPPAAAPMSPLSMKAKGMLDLNPTLHRAVVTDATGDPEVAVLTIAVRGVGVGEILIPRGKYDGLAVMALLERYAGNPTIH
jgi:hypothetical protein